MYLSYQRDHSCCPHAGTEVLSSVTRPWDTNSRCQASDSGRSPGHRGQEAGAAGQCTPRGGDPSHWDIMPALEPWPVPIPGGWPAFRFYIFCLLTTISPFLRTPHLCRLLRGFSGCASVQLGGTRRRDRVLCAWRGRRGQGLEGWTDTFDPDGLCQPLGLKESDKRC